MRSTGKLLAYVLVWGLAGCGFYGAHHNELSADGVSAPAPKILGVNAFLWRASLETLSFLSLASIDPFGGVIISEWYVANQDERIKVMVHIMDRGLQADGLKVTIFRQQRTGGEWRYAKADPDVAHQLEDAILTRARELRLRDRDTRNL